ncbi:universal stress protein [Nocardioides rubriscoriae]|uniref:universal stress protein n=1 Tax=Nocardioides rubriscoriae TaxID=642762 RepID=UPI0011E052AB|nr:universal stress protein [Nocardioides rubriscoriae]
MSVPHTEAGDEVVCALAGHGSPAALDLAAREARRTGARLLLVTVTDDPHDPDTVALLQDAVARVHTSYPDLHVAREAVEGDWVAATLARIGRHARYVVIERTHHGRLHRLLSGSTAEGVSFKVPAPVLSVPPGWSPETSGTAAVTVGVQDIDEVPALVGLGATEATARGVDLVVVHAAAPPQGHDVADVDVRQDWIDRAHLRLDASIGDAVEPFPDLKVRLDVVPERPLDALLQASTGSALLVLGRRHHEHAWGTHLGPVVRRALLDATCPVLLAPDEEATRAADAAAAVHERQASDRRAEPGDVVVAVGEDDAAGAVRFAVAEATSRGVGVHLVHVVRMPAVDGVAAAEVWRDAVARGRGLLERAEEHARGATGPDLRLTHRLVDRGSLLTDLVQEAAQACAIVVQHRRLGRAQRLMTWSVTNGVAARTDVPVIVVPAEWSAGPERVGCVVVGLQDLDDVEHVLPVAVEEATRRGLPLRVVHGGRLSEHQEEEMTAAIAALVQGVPDLRVHRVFEDRDAADLLVGAVTTAEIVVVGRRRHTLSRRSHLGPVAREVLDRTGYPVLLAPPAASAPA